MGLLIFDDLKKICDRNAELKSQLASSGFSAFLPRTNYLESFCADVAERELHRKYRIEVAKETLFSSVLGLASNNQKPVERYRSPLLELLRKKRDLANGCPEDELENYYSRPDSWIRTQIDPCERRRAEMEGDDNGRFERMLHEEAGDRRGESKLQNYDLAKRFDVSREGRCSLIAAAAEKYGKELGFTFSQSKTAPLRPTVWKPVNSSWNIIWTVPDTVGIGFSPFASEENWRLHNRVLSMFAISISNPRGEVVRHTKAGQIFRIDYNCFAPEFGNAYGAFFDNNELEHIVRAHFTLLSFIIDEIVVAVEKVISS